MGKKHRTYPDDLKDKKIKGQREAIKKLEKEVRRLKSELATLNAAFKKSAAYMSTESKDLSVKELIKAAEKNHTLEQAKIEKEEKYSNIDEKERVRRKFQNWGKSSYGCEDEEQDN